MSVWLHVKYTVIQDGQIQKQLCSLVTMATHANNLFFVTVKPSLKNMRFKFPGNALKNVAICIDYRWTHVIALQISHHTSKTYCTNVKILSHTTLEMFI